MVFEHRLARFYAQAHSLHFNLINKLITHRFDGGAYLGAEKFPQISCIVTAISLAGMTPAREKDLLVGWTAAGTPNFGKVCGVRS
jgi:hypothetical protein